MKLIISAFPIDVKFQKEIGIYHSNHVSLEDAGHVINSLIENGYHECDSFTWDRKDFIQFSMHFVKEEK